MPSRPVALSGSRRPPRLDQHVPTAVRTPIHSHHHRPGHRATHRVRRPRFTPDRVILSGERLHVSVGTCDARGRETDVSRATAVFDVCRSRVPKTAGVVSGGSGAVQRETTELAGRQVDRIRALVESRGRTRSRPLTRPLYRNCQSRPGRGRRAETASRRGRLARSVTGQRTAFFGVRSAYSRSFDGRSGVERPTAERESFRADSDTLPAERLSRFTRVSRQPH